MCIFIHFTRQLPQMCNFLRNNIRRQVFASVKAEKMQMTHNPIKRALDTFVQKTRPLRRCPFTSFHSHT